MHKFAVHVVQSLIAGTIHTVHLPLAEAQAVQGGHGEALEAGLEDPKVAVGPGVIQKLLPREAGDGGGLGPGLRQRRQVEDVHGGQGDQGPHSEVITHSQAAQLRNVLQTRDLEGYQECVNKVFIYDVRDSPELCHH